MAAEVWHSMLVVPRADPVKHRIRQMQAQQQGDKFMLFFMVRSYVLRARC
jgi:hypothetical protein